MESGGGLVIEVARNRDGASEAAEGRAGVDQLAAIEIQGNSADGEAVQIQRAAVIDGGRGGGAAQRVQGGNFHKTYINGEGAGEIVGTGKNKSPPVDKWRNIRDVDFPVAGNAASPGEGGGGIDGYA